MEGILETLRQAYPNIDPLVEYLDWRRFPQEDNIKSLVQVYQQRYAQKKIEVVIANDNEALEFALKYRARLFPEAAIVFCGVNDYREDMIAGQPRVTGVVEKVDAAGTIEVALKLHPQARSLVVIADASEEAQDALQIIKGVAPRFASRINFRFLVGLTIQEMLQELERLPPDSLILLAYFTRDRSGNVYSYDTVLSQMGGRTAVPIYGLYTFGLGKGIVGGQLLDGSLVGEQAARYAVRILGGEPVGEMPVVQKSFSQPMFDYDQILRYGLKTSQLPPNSAVIRRLTAVYATYKKIIWGGAALLLLLSLSVVILFLNILKRRRVEKALRQAEENYRSIFENAVEGIFQRTPEGRYLRVNPALARMFGYASPAEMLGEVVDIKEQVFVNPQRYQEFQESMADRGMVQGFEYQAYRQDGRVFWVSENARTVRDENGAILYYEGFKQDITEHKWADEALKKAEREKDLILSSISEYVVCLNLHQRVIWANWAISEAVGLTPDQLVGRYCYELWPGSNQICRNCPVTETLKTGEVQEGEVLAPNGRIWHARAFPVRDAGGQLFGVVEVARDITQRKKAEEAWRQSEERYRALIQNLPVGIYRTTAYPTGKIILANPAMARMFGCDSIEEFLQLPVEDLYVNPADRQAFIDKLFSQGQLCGEELRLKKKDGTPLWVAVTAHLVRNESGEVEYSDGMIVDITEHKRLEEQFRQSQKMEAVGRLAGGVAHDFNNLLTTIMGYSQFLLMGLSDNDPLKRDVEEIIKAGDLATALTHQLLAFSRRQVLEPQVLDINVVIANLEKMLRRLIGEDIDLVVSCDPDINRVMADPGQIEQVLMNLAVNARDAMAQGGKLTIETANVILDESYTHRHLGVKSGPYIMLAVSDTGCGMDAETKSRIFEPFFTTKEVGKGTGLGLSTVYGIIRQSGGQIEVYSEPGQGTSFKIYLPQFERGREAVPESLLPLEYLRGSETILLVEDDEVVRKMVHKLLERSGYQVLEVRKGSDALQLCENHTGPIHLMITDVVMPGMSGPDLAGRLAALRPEMHVLFMSGYAQDAVVHHGALDRGIAFLQKPFRADILVRKVRQVLDSPPLGPG
ncbi:MAG: ABC transporter substrate binding protein [Thermodesulfobacteriota bacterium]